MTTRGADLWYKVAGVVLVLVMVAAGGWLWWAHHNRPEGKAIDACETYTSAALKSPSTAKFTAVAATSDGAGQWTVQGSVDSENSFGAAVRSGFACRVDEGADFKVTDFGFDDGAS